MNLEKDLKCFKIVTLIHARNTLLTILCFTDGFKFSVLANTNCSNRPLIKVICPKPTCLLCLVLNEEFLRLKHKKFKLTSKYLEKIILRGDYVINEKLINDFKFKFLSIIFFLLNKIFIGLKNL